MCYFGLCTYLGLGSFDCRSTSFCFLLGFRVAIRKVSPRSLEWVDFFQWELLYCQTAIISRILQGLQVSQNLTIFQLKSYVSQHSCQWQFCLYCTVHVRIVCFFFSCFFLILGWQLCVYQDHCLMIKRSNRYSCYHIVYLEAVYYVNVLFLLRQVIRCIVKRRSDRLLSISKSIPQAPFVNSMR